MTEPKKRIRCAIYTRKSTEEGLDMEFNSLDAQREAAESYINSQRHEGWTLVPTYYDDGGYSGGSMERPALKALMDDIEKGMIDVVVVYKVDRLSRSLSDFAKLVDLFEKYNVSFVSVTQQFNTTTSMGRLTLNILLSFAQFEREVIGERIRDKVAASKKKGMWMGGTVPIGYDVVDRKIIINETEAKLVKLIFERFVALGSTTLLVKELRERGYRTKRFISKTGRERGGGPINKVFLYRLLQNRIYLGEIEHKGNIFPGQHRAIIDKELWDKAQANMAENPRKRANRVRRKRPALLLGLARCGGCGSTMTPTYCKKPDGRLYRYYRPHAVMQNACEECPIGSVPAAQLEDAVVAQVHALLQRPEMVVRVWREAVQENPKLTEREVGKALQGIHEIWNELFPAEQERLLRLLVEKITVHPDRVDIRIRADGMNSLVRELEFTQNRKAAA